MSALAMSLTAAMAVPGDGSEKVSGETVQMAQPLNMKGQWRALLYGRGPTLKGKAYVEDGPFKVRVPLPWARRTSSYGEVLDEGSGNLRIGRCLGIYKQDGDRLRICLGYPDTGNRPTAFRAENGQCLIELRRIKSTE